MMTLKLKNKLLKREKLGNLRKLTCHQNLIDFASNDYLGLGRSPLLSDLVAKEIRQKSHLNGWGSTGSRLLTGNSFYAEKLEDRIANFHGFEAGLLFNCGYMANLGLISTIGDHEDTILFDANIHASTRDGIVLSKANAFAFRHNDLIHLEKRLKNCKLKGDRFICIESIYSTDGSMAPLPEICRMAKKYEAHLIVDEAHAIGAYGLKGKGVVAEQHLSSDVFAQIVTFGKALGTHGAIVLGNSTLKEALINFATSYIYTTALPMPSLGAIKCSYDLFPEMEKERNHLKKLIQICGNAMNKGSKTHIQSIPVQVNMAKKWAQKIAKAGFDVRALLSPTVQRGKEVLRICLHAFNTEDELNMLLKEILYG